MLPSGLPSASFLAGDSVKGSWEESLFDAIQQIELERNQHSANSPSKSAAKYADKGYRFLAGIPSTSGGGASAGFGTASTPETLGQGAHVPGMGVPSWVAPGAAGLVSGAMDYLKREDAGSALTHGLLAGSLTAVNPVLGLVADMGLGLIQNSLYGDSGKPRMNFFTVDEKNFMFPNIADTDENRRILENWGIPYTEHVFERPVKRGGDVLEDETWETIKLKPDQDFLKNMDYETLYKLNQSIDFGGLGHGTLSEKYPYAVEFANTGNDQELEKAIIQRFDEMLGRYDLQGKDVEKLLRDADLGHFMDFSKQSETWVLGEDDPESEMTRLLQNALGTSNLKSYGTLPSGLY